MSFDPPEKLCGVVLAAGSSSRLGVPKQLVRRDGRPLVARAAELARRACGGAVTVVTGAQHDEVTDALANLDVRAAYNPRWREGMGASLRHGAAMIESQADALLVMLVDQPLLEESDLQRLVDAWRNEPDRVAAAEYAGTLGVPAIFPRRCIAQLKELRGDSGARAIIARELAVTRVAMENAAFDLDTPEALKRLGAC